jgi:hypothetical protein
VRGGQAHRRTVDNQGGGGARWSGGRDDDSGGRSVLVEYSKSWLFPGAGEQRAGIVR